jgi:hypothetical protein
MEKILLNKKTHGSDYINLKTIAKKFMEKIGKYKKIKNLMYE